VNETYEKRIQKKEAVKALQEVQKTESLRNGNPVKPSTADRHLEWKSTTRKENN